MKNAKITRIYGTNEAIVEFMDESKGEFENVEVFTSTINCVAINSKF